MSQPFYNNNEMRNEAELNERLPKSKGMNIVGIIDKLDFKKYVVGVTQETYKNDVRFDTDNTPQTVAKFQKLIKEGDYLPKTWGGPTITWTGKFHEDGHPLYELVTGWHRTTALDNEDVTFGYFVVVEFETYKGKSANYWKGIWKSNENEENTTYVQNPRKDKDIVGKVVSMLNDGTIEYDKSDASLSDMVVKVQETLEEMNQTPSKVKEHLPGILSKMKAHTHIVYQYSQKDWNFFKSNYANNNPNKVVKTINFETVAEKDYEFRWMMQYAHELVQSAKFDKNGNVVDYNTDYESVTVLAKVGNGNVNKVKDTRTAKKDFFTNNLDVMKKFVKVMEKMQNTPNVKYAPQLVGEKKVYNDTKELPLG